MRSWKKKKDKSAIFILSKIHPPLCEIIKNMGLYLVKAFRRFGLNQFNATGLFYSLWSLSIPMKPLENQVTRTETNLQPKAAGLFKYV